MGQQEQFREIADNWDAYRYFLSIFLDPADVCSPKMQVKPISPRLLIAGYKFRDRSRHSGNPVSGQRRHQSNNRSNMSNVISLVEKSVTAAGKMHRRDQIKLMDHSDS